MESYIGCLATTGYFIRGDQRVRFAKEALEHSAKEINEESHVPLCLDHDPSLMPIGRTVRAWVQNTGDEYSLFSEFLVVLDAEGCEHKRSGTQVANLCLGNSNRGFASRECEDYDNVVISVDRCDFESSKSWGKFLQDMKRVNHVVSAKEYARNSVDPEGIMLFSMAGWSVAIWVLIRAERFARHLVDETLRKVGDNASDKLSRLISESMGLFEESVSPRIEKYHVVIVVQGKPDLVLVIERKKGDTSYAIEEYDLKSIGSILEQYSDILTDAQEVTLLKDKMDVWKFQHVKTKNGNIVGNLENYQEAVKQWKRLRRLHGEVGISPAGETNDE